MSPARSRRSASHAAGTHGWLPQKTGRPGLRRGGVGGYNLHSVPPNSPPDCGTVAHQPRAGCIRLVLVLSWFHSLKVRAGKHHSRRAPTYHIIIYKQHQHVFVCSKFFVCLQFVPFEVPSTLDFAVRMKETNKVGGIAYAFYNSGCGRRCG